MRKINDFFAAGTIFGAIVAIVGILLTLLVLAFHLKIRTAWGDWAALLFKPPYVDELSAQLFGIIAGLGGGIIIGVIAATLIKFTGRDFAYLKSTVIYSTTAMLVFIVVYPSLGLTADQKSIATNYFSFFSNLIYAICFTYLLLRFSTVGEKSF